MTAYLAGVGVVQQPAQYHWHLECHWYAGQPQMWVPTVVAPALLAQVEGPAVRLPVHEPCAEVRPACLHML